MHWREIRQNGEIFDHLAGVWEYERTLSRWYRASSSVWTPKMDDFEAFVSDCGEVQGLFDDSKLVALIYIEKQADPSKMVIHLSMVGKLTEAQFVAQMSALRNQMFRRGVVSIRGWVLRKNRPLMNLLHSCGFLDADLTMKHGESHGKVLIWQLMEARRA